MKGRFPLLVAIAVTWALVWSGTQRIPQTAFGVDATVLIGVVLTLAVVWRYPPAIHNPRHSFRALATSFEAPSGAALVSFNQTLPYLRNGLSPGAAIRSADILLPLTDGTAVCLTDRTRLLGSARHSTGSSEDAETDCLNSLVHESIKLGKTVSESKNGRVEVVVPMSVGGEVVGTLWVTFDDADRCNISTLEAIGNLLSVNLELAEVTKDSQKSAKANLVALRAQINPHFLFNILNTIASKSRTDPDEVRQLLQRLADFFRYSIRQDGHFSEFTHEYFFVRTYLSLEQSRFGDRLRVQYDIEPQVLPAKVPVLTIQPLVENAVKHGIAGKAGGGTVTLRAKVDPLAGAIKITVLDDGVGMEEEQLSGLIKELSVVEVDPLETGSVALRNISERLAGLYGERYRLKIRSSPTKGTRVDLEIPF